VQQGLAQAVAELNEGILNKRGLELTQVYDETEYIHSAVDLVNENIFAGGALTMIVLMVFLHRGWKTPLFCAGIALTAAAAAEELLFRGVVQSSLVRALDGEGFVLAILLSTAFFASLGWWMISVLAATIVFAIIARTAGVGPAAAAHVAFAVGAVAVWPAVFDHRRPDLAAAVPLGLLFSGVLVALVVGASRGRGDSGV